jgi:hypothetical protein
LGEHTDYPVGKLSRIPDGGWSGVSIQCQCRGLAQVHYPLDE